MAEAPLLAGREQIEQVVALTVLLSVLLHGLTAAPSLPPTPDRSRRWGRMRRRSNERSRCRPAWAPYRPVFSEVDEAGCGIHMERDRDMSKEEITQTEPQTQPQAEPPIVSTGPGAAMPSQGRWARAPTWQVARTVAVALLTTAVVLGALFLLWQVRTFIGWFVIALFLAAVLNPAVNWLQRRHRMIKRPLAIGSPTWGYW